jgi:tetratricopeptide (TPR) repeat protein
MPPSRWPISGENIGAMIALVDQALALNSNYARGWHIGGLLRIWAGQPDIAIEHLEASLRLSPRVRIGASRTDLGTAHFYSRRFDEAVPKLLLAIQEDPSFPLPYRILAACYAQMGRLDEGREIVERLRAISPVVIPEYTSYLRNTELRELLLSGLRLAAGEGTPRSSPPMLRGVRGRWGGRGRHARISKRCGTGSSIRSHQAPRPHRQDHRRRHVGGICQADAVRCCLEGNYGTMTREPARP